MLTRAGWTVAALAALAIVSGRLVGSMELFVAGGVAAMVVVVAGVHVVTTRCNLSAVRTVQPSRVHAGDIAIVELSITNDGHRRSPTAVVIDLVGHRRQARVRIPPLAAGHSTSGRYQLATDRRGHLDLGPLRVQVSDPFGLTRVDTTIGTTDQLVVFPVVERVAAPPLDLHGDPDTGIPQPRRWTDGDEFHALRGYANGDDLRRVHWPTSARVDELMVRQDEAHQQDRTTVVLDTRGTVHTSDSFEQCVSAAASILVAASRRGDLLSLATTTTPPTPTASTTPRRAPATASSASGDATIHALDQLATVKPTPHDAAAINRDAGVTVDTAGVVVVVTTIVGVANIHALLEASSATRQTTGVLMVFPGPDTPGTPDSPGTPDTPDSRRPWMGPMSWPVVEVTATDTMAEVWAAWAAKRHPYSRPARPVRAPEAADAAPAVASVPGRGDRP